MDYNSFRHFADSWVLLAMTIAFIGIVIWAFRPGTRRLYDDAADIPFRNDQPRGDQGRDAHYPQNHKDVRSNGNGTSDSSGSTQGQTDNR